MVVPVKLQFVGKSADETSSTVPITLTEFIEFNVNVPGWNSTMNSQNTVLL